MSYLIVGALAFALLYRTMGWRLAPRHADWRVATGVLAVGLFAAAGFVGSRGGWGKALVLLALAGVLTASARWPRAARSAPYASSSMSMSEARAALGVGPEAGPTEIKAAYAHLIRRVHPDQGGAPGLAAHLNQARDLLLKS